MKSIYNIAFRTVITSVLSFAVSISISCSSATRIDVERDYDADSEEDGYMFDSGRDPEGDIPDVDGSSDEFLEVASFVEMNHPTDVSIEGNYIYVSELAPRDEVGGFRIFDVGDIQNPRLVREVDSGDAWAIHVHDGYVYLAEDAGDIGIFDVSDPENPILVNRHVTPGAAIDVSALGSMVFVADYYEGLRIIDITDPAHTNELGSWIMTGYTFRVHALGSSVVTISNDNLLRVIDVVTPNKPAELVAVNIPGMPFSLAVGENSAYVTAERAGVRIIDISDPGNASNVGSFTYQNVTNSDFRALAAINDIFFVTATVNDWRGILIVDASDPANPQEIGRERTSRHPNNLIADENYLYTTMTDRGLTIYSYN